MLGPDLSNQLKASILPSLDQPPKSLAEYSGKNGMLLLFVNASCPFSQGAAKDLPAMADIFAKQGLMIAIVNIDDAEARVREHYAGKQPVPVLFDVTTATHERWAIDSVPTAIVVSSSQKQVYRGTAVWAGVAAAAESGLSLSTGSLRVQPKGSGYG